MHAIALQSLLPTYRSRKLALILAVWLTFAVTFFITEEALPRLNLEVLLELVVEFLYFWAQIEFILRINKRLDRQFSDAPYSARRYALETLAVLASNLLLTTLLLAGPAYYLLEVADADAGRTPRNLVVLLIRQLYLLPGTFTLLVYGLLAAYFAVRNLQQIELEAERYRKESVQELFESLKNQVNPEFLFKSLHTLSTLIYRDKDRAARFVEELSLVYRYVLDHKEEELVELPHELDFAKSYLFLLSVRHPDALTWQLPASPRSPGLLIPPLTLQFLFDSLLPVFEISPEHPLEMRLGLRGDTLLVTCRGRKAKGASGDFEARLRGIAERYRYLTDRRVSGTAQAGGLEVRVPLLEMTYEKLIPKPV